MTQLALKFAVGLNNDGAIMASAVIADALDCTEEDAQAFCYRHSPVVRVLEHADYVRLVETKGWVGI
jgi:hypothetical protein